MNIFITGATGYIGSAVSDALVRAGHRVAGLARSDAAASRLRARGIDPVAGDLATTHALASAASAADAVIHLAQPGFDPGGDMMAQMQAGAQLMGSAIDALLGALEGSGKALIITGGTGAYGDTGERVVDEDVPVLAVGPMARMAENERRVLGERGVRGIVIRPAIVYGRNGGPVTMLLAQARQPGRVAMAGPGDNLLSTVHIDDVADLYALALEKAPAGTLLNGVAEPWVTQKALLRAVSLAAGLDGSVERLPDEVARDLAYGMGGLFARNMRVSGARARAMLGWQPWRPSILDDLLQTQPAQTQLAAA